MERIAIVVAMEKEIALLRGLLQNPVEKREGDFRAVCGKAGGKEIVLTGSGIGKVAAATGIAWLHYAYRPDAVINSGVAGGIGGGLSVGDIVAGSEVCYHDVDCGEGNASGQVQGFPVQFAASPELLRALPSEGVKQGLICTGDQFITDSERLRGIKAAFPDALAVDMESAAMAQACYRWRIPFLSLRIISDTPCADNDNMQQYKDFWTEAPEVNFKLVRELLERL